MAERPPGDSAGPDHSKRPVRPPSPAGRVVLGLAAILVGILVSSFVGAAVIAANDWDLDVSSALGAEIGRSAGQVGAGLPLDDRRMPLGVAVMLNIPLWACFAGVPLLARARGLDWRGHLAWQFKARDIPIGLGLGLAAQLVVIPLVYAVIFWLFGEQDVAGPARDLIAGVDSSFDVAALLALTLIGAPLAEEILFRGLLHRGLVEMHTDFGSAGTVLATVLSSAVFGAVHFQVLQFPGLMAFGVVAAVAMMRTNRLGTAVFAHLGFNLSTVAFLLQARF